MKYIVKVGVFGDDDGLIKVHTVEVESTEETIAHIYAMEVVRELYPDDYTMAAKTAQ